MRIAHCVRTLDPAGGGLPAVAQRLAAAQARLGHDVCLLSQDRSCAAEAFLERGAAPGIDRVRHCSVSGLPLLAKRNEYENSRDARSLVESMDVVHLHGVWDPILARVANAAFRAGVPYVVAPHGMLDPWSLRQRAWKKRIALRLSYRAILERATFIHALHDDEAGFAREVAPKCRTEVLPNGVFLEEIPSSDTKDPAGSDDYFERRFGWPGASTVLFLGRLHHKKGLDILAEAFCGLLATRPEARLVVAGPDEGERAPFERLVHTLGIAERVVVPGPIYGAEKYDALRSAACFALPSRQEGFSVAVLEALACETPVVITEACHFPDIERAGAGFVVGNNAAEHAEAYRRILSSEQVRLKFGRAGRSLVSSRFTWEVIAQSAIDLYEENVKPARAAVQLTRSS